VLTLPLETGPAWLLVGCSGALAWRARSPLAVVLSDTRTRIRRGYGDEARPRRGAPSTSVSRIHDPRHLELALLAEATTPGELMLPIGAPREAARRSGYPDDLALPVDLIPITPTIRRRAA
jgi:hypothetical protein